MATTCLASLLTAGALVGPVSATEVIGGPLLAGAGVIERPLPNAKPLPKINADTWLLADLTTGDVLAAKNPHARVRPASTLKTLTSAALMPLLDRNAVHTATDRDVRVDGSHVGIVSGATYTVWDLWNGLLLPSGNDAAMALADQYGGAPKTVETMQTTAHQLQAYDTHVVNPSGLDADGQVSSAYDMALIAAAALKIADFRTVTSTKSYNFPGYMPKAGQPRKTFKIFTENRLLRHNYPGITGGKTGFTSLAHRTFWAAADRGGHLLVVTLFQIHEPTEQAATALLNWGFANRTALTPIGTLVRPVAANSLPSTSSTTSPSVDTSGASSTTDPLASADSTDQPSSSKLPLLIGLLATMAGVTAVGLRRRAISRRSGARALGRHVAVGDSRVETSTTSVS
jgi:D-alanyl-D-alanine carboxypeptidase (penicillin-binding protein 5/6)